MHRGVFTFRLFFFHEEQCSNHTNGLANSFLRLIVVLWTGFIGSAVVWSLEKLFHFQQRNFLIFNEFSVSFAFLTFYTLYNILFVSSVSSTLFPLPCIFRVFSFLDISIVLLYLLYLQSPVFSIFCILRFIFRIFGHNLRYLFCIFPFPVLLKDREIEYNTTMLLDLDKKDYYSFDHETG